MYRKHLLHSFHTVYKIGTVIYKWVHNAMTPRRDLKKYFSLIGLTTKLQVSEDFDTTECDKDCVWKKIFIPYISVIRNAFNSLRCHFDEWFYKFKFTAFNLQNLAQVIKK